MIQYRLIAFLLFMSLAVPLVSRQEIMDDYVKLRRMYWAARVYKADMTDEAGSDRYLMATRSFNLMCISGVRKIVKHGDPHSFLGALSATYENYQEKIPTRVFMRRLSEYCYAGGNAEFFENLGMFELFHDYATAAWFSSDPQQDLEQIGIVREMMKNGEWPLQWPQSSYVTKGIAKGTGYYPHPDSMEGGYKDMLGRPLRTLQEYLEGKVEYVAVALDRNLYLEGVIGYGDVFRIPELEKAHNIRIEFRAVDTGSAFLNKKFTRIDICCKSKEDTFDLAVNGKLTLQRLESPSLEELKKLLLNN